MKKKITFAKFYLRYIWIKIGKKIIIAIVLIFLILLFSLTKQDPLKIKFFDEKKGSLLKGIVYVDDMLVGETDGYLELAEEHCNEEHKIKLSNEEVELSWDIFPKDCKLDQLVLKYTASKKKSRKILFVFLEKNKSISGELFLDGEYIGNIDGNYSIKRDICEEIEEIKIVKNNEPFIWQYNKGLCNENDILEFSVS